MTDAPYDNQMLQRFLLGTATENEIARLDELSLTDDECALALAAVENDLVDAYASNSLPAAERAQFERYYLRSSWRREKAHFALELQRLGQRTAAPLTVGQGTDSSFLRLNFAWFRLTAVQQAGLAAATLILLAGCSWLFMENQRLRQAVSREHEALAQREAELQASQNSAAKHEREIAAMREQLAHTAPSPTPPNALPSVPALNIIAFTLTPPLRGAANVPMLKVPASAQQVAVRLELESLAYARYRVVLRDPQTQRALWQSGRLAPIRGKNGISVNVQLAAKLFALQRYAFELSGITADNVEERVSSYPFEVRQP